MRDKDGRGRKPVYGADVKARVIQKACSKPAGGYTNLSQRRIAEQVKISQSSVQKILKENALKPRKVECWCGKSTDPEFEEKMLNVIHEFVSWLSEHYTRNKN